MWSSRISVEETAYSKAITCVSKRAANICAMSLMYLTSWLAPFLGVSKTGAGLVPTEFHARTNLTTS